MIWQMFSVTSYKFKKQKHKGDSFKAMVGDTPNNQELPLLAAIFTSILCIGFGANAVAIKISLSGLGAFSTAGLRFSIATLAIFLWAKISQRSFTIKKGQAHQLLIISMLFTVQLGLLYFGLNKTNASRGTLLINLQPFFVLFLAHRFIPGDQITKRKILGLFMGFTGMAMVFLGRKGITTDIQIGDFMILINAFIWACNTVYTKKIINAFDPFQIVLYPMIFSVPFFFLAGLLWDGTMIEYVNLNVLIALLYQGLVTASFGFVAWNNMLQKYGAVSLHSFLFIMPVSGVLLGGLVLGEPITFNILLALVLIVSGILMVNLKTRKYAPLFPPRGV
jgi:drug/metabolite transporter (DMT)-like permease